MRIFSDCLWLGLCFKRYRDDEQMFADQLESQASSRSVVHLEQPEPEPQVPMATTATTTTIAEREVEQRTTRDTPKDTEPIEQTRMRDSHSPARLEKICICADVHQYAQQSAQAMQGQQQQQQQQRNLMGSKERFSGVAIKDEIEVFTDVKLDNSGCYTAF